MLDSKAFQGWECSLELGSFHPKKGKILVMAGQLQLAKQ
jgi:hypothetical protein